MPIGNALSWLPWGFLAFGLLFLFLGLRTVIKDRRRRESWPTYPGRVVGSRLDDGRTQSQVSYLRDGREITFWNRYSSTTMSDPVGRDVEVMVNPEDPEDAVVGHGLVGGGLVGFAFIVFGIVAAVAGVSALF